MKGKCQSKDLDLVSIDILVAFLRPFLKLQWLLDRDSNIIKNIKMQKCENLGM